jgi:hypothetical protein
MIFKRTININELINDAVVSEMVDGDVYQIIHKGQDVKVMMTQEYYFQLMSRLEKSEGTTDVVKYDPEQLMSDFQNKIKS